ncbi:MAG: cytochrome bd-I ubiquinol oxidase subunit CydA, partial [Oxalobacteraceae bacterium]
IEAMWETEAAPAGFNAFAIPNQETRTNHYALHIPWVMGLIGTRSFNTEIPGINELVERAKDRIRNGQVAYAALQQVRADRTDLHAKAMFDLHWQDMGYALLLKRYREDIGNATEQEITKAAADTIPRVAPLFWSFRLMAGVGFYFIGFFAVAFWLATVQKLDRYRWFLKVALWSLPLPWLAIEAGWLIAEYGRQPWIIDGVLPTFLAASGLKLHQVIISLTGFVLIYTSLAVVDVYLLRKVILKGPDEVPGGGRRPNHEGTPLAAASSTVA